ncbi:hypothetical protein QTP86_022089 [Hemibagrus guttatus]|nr:hypothetical protein QTP86_022089 [Hemibagrus guttatus]
MSARFSNQKLADLITSGVLEEEDNTDLEEEEEEDLKKKMGKSHCHLWQYMPSKQAKYGIRIWLACDAKSSYAWKIQVYTEKLTSGGPENNQGMQVVLDVTDVLRGHNVV